MKNFYPKFRKSKNHKIFEIKVEISKSSEEGLHYFRIVSKIVKNICNLSSELFRNFDFENFLAFETVQSLYKYA